MWMKEKHMLTDAKRGYPPDSYQQSFKLAWNVKTYYNLKIEKAAQWFWGAFLFIKYVLTYVDFTRNKGKQKPFYLQ